MEIGQRVGRLEILDIYKSKYKICLCKCDCGTIKEVIYSNLNKNTFSCGCLNKDNNRINGIKRLEKTSIEERQLKYIYAQYKSHAKYNNRYFDLTKEELKELVFNNCYYCGEELSNLVKESKYGGPFYYNGIDRLDSSKGYISENTPLSLDLPFSPGIYIYFITLPIHLLSCRLHTTRLLFVVYSELQLDLGPKNIIY